MNYTSSNVLVNVHQYKYVDGHLWVYVAEGLKSNKDVAYTVIQIQL